MHGDLLVGSRDAQVQHGSQTSGTQEKAPGGKAGGWLIDTKMIAVKNMIAALMQYVENDIRHT